jgi:signal transduction histidine kinase
LLLIARIENRDFEMETDVNMNQLIGKVLEDLSDQISYKNLKVSLNSSETCIYRMNYDLARIMIVNLLRNALVYNFPGGTVEIMVSKNSIRISNTGEMQSLDQNRVFTRFYKEKHAAHSTGLGLAIIRSIAELFQLKVSYLFSNGHIFTVEFPG